MVLFGIYYLLFWRLLLLFLSWDLLHSFLEVPNNAFVEWFEHLVTLQEHFVEPGSKKNIFRCFLYAVDCVLLACKSLIGQVCNSIIWDKTGSLFRWACCCFSNYTITLFLMQYWWTMLQVISSITGWLVPNWLYKLHIFYNLFTMVR